MICVTRAVAFAHAIQSQDYPNALLKIHL